MNLIEELKNYCDINNPVGALMLSGEWGCGKTYLIKTKFIPSVKDTYVFVCISLFGIDSLDKLDLNKNADEVFIISLKKFIKDYFNARQIEEIKDRDAVLITTPFSYISNNIKRKTQIWVDIGSNTWNMKIEKDLANPLVLKKSFRDEDIYTSDMEESYKKYFLYNTVYNLLKYAENVYAYKSDYSINGYIQEGGLYSLLLRLINKGGDALE